MDIWQTGSPDRPVPTGWVGRWLDATGPDPLRAVSVGATLPPLAVGREGGRGGAAAEPASRRRPASSARGVAALARPDPADPPTQALAARSTRDAAGGDPAARAGRSPRPRTPTSTDGEAQRPGGSAGGQGQLGRQLAAVSACIRAGVPTRVYAVSLGGFDTHADEKGTQSRLLGELDAAVSGFLRGLDGDERGRRVVVAVYSEFGRRVAANASDGTDHGTAGTVLVAGRSVRGGFYGDQPSLTALDDGDLRVTTDFRSVYGDAARAGPGHRRGPGARRHPARAGLPLRARS